MTKQLHPELRAMGYEPAEGRIIFVLRDCFAKTGLTVRDVTDKASLPQPTVSRWLRTLESKGLVRSLGNNKDRRHSNFALTAKGRQQAALIVRTARDHEAKVLSKFSSDEKQTLVQMLQDFLAELENQ